MSRSHRPRKRLNFADDTPVSACVSECIRSRERPRRTSLSAMRDDRRQNTNDKAVAWHRSFTCISIPYFFFDFFVSQSADSSYTDDYPVPATTVNIATDVSVVSDAWVMSSPILRSVIIQPVPPTAVVLRATNGSPFNVSGFLVFSLTLITITNDVEAFVLPSHDSDSLLSDNSVMSTLGAVLD